MSVSVEYEGIVLVESAEPQRLEAGLFLPLAAPMPVGTPLSLRDGGCTRSARVSSVRETAESGVFLAGPAGLARALADLPVVAGTPDEAQAAGGEAPPAEAIADAAPQEGAAEAPAEESPASPEPSAASLADDEAAFESRPTQPEMPIVPAAFPAREASGVSPGGDAASQQEAMALLETLVVAPQQVATAAMGDEAGAASEADAEADAEGEGETTVVELEAESEEDDASAPRPGEPAATANGRPGPSSRKGRRRKRR